MIRGNLLSYASVEIPWYSRSLQNSTLNSVVSSILITLISYQAAALIFNLILGVKKKKSAKVKTLGILMLTWKSSSPLAVFNSLLRKDWITRKYFKGDLPPGTKISRDAASVRWVTGLMLFVLLIVAPVLDTVFITLTLSRTTELTFSDAGFGGVRVGVHEKLETLETVPFMTFCDLVKFESRKNDFIDAKFSMCRPPVLPQSVRDSPTGFEIEVISESQVRVNVIVRGNGAVGATICQLETKGATSLVKVRLTSDSVRPLTKMALELLRKECGEIEEIGALPVRGEGRIVASIQVRCGRNTPAPNPEYIPTPKSPEMIISEMLRRKVSLIPADDLLVESFVPKREVKDVIGYHFLQRRERNASTFTLAVLTLAVLVLRALLGFFLTNDVSDCLEYVIKDRLQFNRCDSMFWAGKERIKFRGKFQEGEQAELGLEREDMREVERFLGGRVGGHGRLSDKT